MSRNSESDSSSGRPLSSTASSKRVRTGGMGAFRSSLCSSDDTLSDALPMARNAAVSKVAGQAADLRRHPIPRLRPMACS
eukprot:scaffold25665_cov135-Isochrysis_galbana.AAC.5